MFFYKDHFKNESISLLGLKHKIEIQVNKKVILLLWLVYTGSGMTCHIFTRVKFVNILLYYIEQIINIFMFIRENDWTCNLSGYSLTDRHTNTLSEH